MCRELFTIIMLALVGEMVSGGHLGLLSRAISDFSQKLYPLVALPGENVVYSPLSLHSALTMSYYGARGTTATQMAETLGFTWFAGIDPHQAYHDIILQLNSVNGVELYTANALFLNPNFPIEPDFVREARDNYFSLASHLDFHAHGGPEEPINLFVRENTHGTINEILSRGSIDDSTVLVIINTVFFNGTWATQFDKKSTRKQDFHKLNGGISQVDMMKDIMRVYLKYDVEHGIDILQLPFTNSRFGLYIVLPKTYYGIYKLERLLRSPNFVDGLFNDLQPTRAIVSIPKFRLETLLQLNKPLQKLGMKDAFVRGHANFRGISPADIYISDVLQKAVIEVQETGTVAAAATAIREDFQSAIYDRFVADHPFVFFLRDNESKLILFQGKFSG